MTLKTNSLTKLLLEEPIRNDYFIAIVKIQSVFLDILVLLFD